MWEASTARHLDHHFCLLRLFAPIGRSRSRVSAIVRKQWVETGAAEPHNTLGPCAVHVCGLYAHICCYTYITPHGRPEPSAHLGSIRLPLSLVSHATCYVRRKLGVPQGRTVTARRCPCWWYIGLRVTWVFKPSQDPHAGGAERFRLATTAPVRGRPMQPCFCKPLSHLTSLPKVMADVT